MGGNPVVPAASVAYDRSAGNLCRKSRFIDLLADPSVEAQPAISKNRIPDVSSASVRIFSGRAATTHEAKWIS